MPDPPVVGLHPPTPTIVGPDGGEISWSEVPATVQHLQPAQSGIVWACSVMDGAGEAMLLLGVFSSADRAVAFLTGDELRTAVAEQRGYDPAAPEDASDLDQAVAELLADAQVEAWTLDQPRLLRGAL